MECAADYSCNREGQEIHRGNAGGNGDEFEGYWREALGDDDPQSPIFDQLSVAKEIVRLPIHLNQPLSQGSPSDMTNAVADQSSGGRGNHADCGQREAPVWPEEQHWDEEQVRQNRKN